MKAAQIANRFYELNNEVACGKTSAETFREILTEDFEFHGPAIKLQGAENYVNLLKQFLSFHESLEIVRQFEKDNEVCTITKLTVKSPQGQKIVMDIAEWCLVENGKLKKHTIFYDPREFMAAFPV